MAEWPEGWTRPAGPDVRRGGAQAPLPEDDDTVRWPGPDRANPTTRLPAAGAGALRPRAPAPRSQASARRAYEATPPRQAPPRPSPGRPAGPPLADPRRTRRSGGARAAHGLRVGARSLRRLPLALLLLVAGLAALALFFFARIDKVDALQDYDGRPEATTGTDWLLVGSDSRAELSAEQRKRLTTGGAAGRRTDTIILLHVPPAGGAPTLVSLPRDSYVPIPGRGRNKLNAAYTLGGAPLLVQTVERATGIRIDHYAEIGFSGFVGLVDAVGGVELCPERAIKDRKSGLDVQKGCQPMDGPTALGYVRARYSDPKGDLGRVERQQEFLGSLFERVTEPGVALNPFRLVRAADAGTKALTLDKRDNVLDLARFALAMRAVAGDNGKKTTVPVADPNYRTRVGSVVLWDRPKARQLFNSLR